MHLRLIVLAGALAAGSCGAQTRVPPTDVDLLAAYCIGIVQRQIVGANEFRAKVSGSNSAADVRATSLMDSYLQELQDRLQRLQSYLIPKISYLDPMSLALASARGDVDYNSTTGVSTAASDECRQSGASDLFQCSQTKVRASALWQRMDRCTRIDFLPF
jgi:hypothetical protein